MTNTVEAQIARAAGRSVSRETMDRLHVFADLLTHWNRKINIVAASTIADLWTRHIIDSAQLVSLANAPKSWVDLGAGGGLPGIIIAALQAEVNPGCRITLVESDRRKCLFMATALREMGLTATIETRRIEATAGMTYDVVSARALAPVVVLLAHAESHIETGGLCIFPKGKRADDELTEARQTWHIDLDRIQSLTDDEASILRIREFSRVSRS